MLTLQEVSRRSKMLSESYQDLLVKAKLKMGSENENIAMFYRFLERNVARFEEFFKLSSASQEKDILAFGNRVLEKDEDAEMEDPIDFFCRFAERDIKCKEDLLDDLRKIIAA